MWFSELIVKHKRKRMLGEIIQFFANREAWKQEQAFFAEEAQRLLEYIPQLPENEENAILEEGLKDVVESMSR